MVAVSVIWSRKFINFGILNTAYITLLPKKEAADFQPISLVHSFAKLITKLLVNRLAGYQMVSANQSAFIKGRFIQDNRQQDSCINRSNRVSSSSWIFL